MHHLQYEFDGWLGDVLLSSFPVFIVTTEVRDALIEINASGVIFDEMEITTSYEFEELYPDQELPKFLWLKAEGKAGQSDIGTIWDGRLVVSQRVLNILKKFGIPNALLKTFDV